MDEGMNAAALVASSADEADCSEHLAGTSPEDSSDGSCMAQKPTDHAEVLAAIKKQVSSKVLNPRPVYGTVAVCLDSLARTPC